ncbi:polyprotein [Apostichopus japonicus]|uniref:Polyprotein n=1 Tax=Stichopus japonicus TaxID=307972 RepID=A0A2G8KMG7_STIJA|nr:polyprotein [Apostichopus japonicus]
MQPIQTSQKEWKEATATKAITSRSYEVETEKGRKFRKGRRFLRASHKPSEEHPSDDVQPDKEAKETINQPLKPPEPNRSPTKVVKGMTPFEAWTGEKPNVSNFRSFGCVAYAHVPKDECQKLDSKARKCICLGYGTETKGYRLYDQKRSKMFFSRDVQFNEQMHGVEKESNDSYEDRHILIDSMSNDKLVADDGAPEAQLRRSERDRRPPDHFGEWVNFVGSNPKESFTVSEALGRSDKSKWVDAIEKEVQSLHDNNVWVLTELPEGRKAVGSKWVFKVKSCADGSVERYKARLVAQGFSQKFGVDYDETFCPVIRFESVRNVLALSVQNDLKVHQMDVTTAFLNGKLNEEVFMKQPDGFVVQGKEHLVCKLKRSIYGLKQSPRCWNETLHITT